MSAELSSLSVDLHHRTAQIAVLEAEVQGTRQLKDEAEDKLDKMVRGCGRVMDERIWVSDG